MLDRHLHLSSKKKESQLQEVKGRLMVGWVVGELCLRERHLHVAEQVKAPVCDLFMSYHFFRKSRHCHRSALFPWFLFLFCLPASFSPPPSSHISGSGPLTLLPRTPHPPGKRISIQVISQGLTVTCFN